MNFHRPGEAYARTALIDECGAVARTSSGRNNRLNQAAFSLGGLVASGLLDESEVEQALFQAAQASGYVAKDGPSATHKTIRSGLAKGKLEPRQVPESSAPIHLSGPAQSAGGTDKPRRPALEPSPAPVPDWTPPNHEGKPKFFAIGADVPRPREDELRRHIYRRDGLAVRIKVKRKSGGFLDLYRVRRPSDGTVG